jgi:hypothetical protein
VSAVQIISQPSLRPLSAFVQDLLEHDLENDRPTLLAAGG